jgi:iron complex outermembrane receptor protein
MPKYYKYKLALTTAVCLASSMPMVAHTQEGGQRQGAQAGAYIEEILITARRREESLQEVPVSVNAFSDIRLQEASVTMY